MPDMIDEVQFIDALSAFGEELGVRQRDGKLICNGLTTTSHRAR
jgi:hypothetical protein